MARGAEDYKKYVHSCTCELPMWIFLVFYQGFTAQLKDIWYFTKVLQLSWRMPLQDSRSFGRDPPHLTLNHGFPIIRLSREIAWTQLSWDLSAPPSGLVATGFEPVTFCSRSLGQLPTPPSMTSRVKSRKRRCRSESRWTHFAASMIHLKCFTKMIMNWDRCPA